MVVFFSPLWTTSRKRRNEIWICAVGCSIGCRKGQKAISLKSIVIRIISFRKLKYNKLYDRGLQLKTKNLITLTLLLLMGHLNSKSHLTPLQYMFAEDWTASRKLLKMARKLYRSDSYTRTKYR